MKTANTIYKYFDNFEEKSFDLIDFKNRLINANFLLEYEKASIKRLREGAKIDFSCAELKRLFPRNRKEWVDETVEQTLPEQLDSLLLKLFRMNIRRSVKDIDILNIIQSGSFEETINKPCLENFRTAAKVNSIDLSKKEYEEAYEIVKTLKSEDNEID